MRRRMADHVNKGASWRHGLLLLGEGHREPKVDELHVPRPVQHDVLDLDDAGKMKGFIIVNRISVSVSNMGVSERFWRH